LRHTESGADIGAIRSRLCPEGSSARHPPKKKGRDRSREFWRPMSNCRLNCRDKEQLYQ
jgi:hypothetical protein